MENHTNDFMETDEIAALLVKLYAEYMSMTGSCHHDKYARAVGIAIRMLTD